MSADDISEFYVHTVTVETFTGVNGYGEDTFSAPVILAAPNGCFVESARKLVRSGAGEQVISETTLYTFPANAPLFTPSSRVTINGVPARVITANLNDSGALDLPDHAAITLT